MNIKYFGIAGEIMSSHPNFDIGQYHTVADLKAGLLNNFQEFKGIAGFMIAVNQEYATDDHVIEQGDEIAIIPPVSGG